MTVSENVASQTLDLVHASDADQGSNAEITYSVREVGASIAVNANTGTWCDGMCGSVCVCVCMHVLGHVCVCGSNAEITYSVRVTGVSIINTHELSHPVCLASLSRRCLRVFVSVRARVCDCARANAQSA